MGNRNPPELPDRLAGPTTAHTPRRWESRSPSSAPRTPKPRPTPVARVPSAPFGPGDDTEQCNQEQHREQCLGKEIVAEGNEGRIDGGDCSREPTRLAVEEGRRRVIRSRERGAPPGQPVQRERPRAARRKLAPGDPTSMNAARKNGYPGGHAARAPLEGATCSLPLASWEAHLQVVGFVARDPDGEDPRRDP